MRQVNKDKNDRELDVVNPGTKHSAKSKEWKETADKCTKMYAPEVVDEIENLHCDLLPHRGVPQLQSK